MQLDRCRVDSHPGQQCTDLRFDRRGSDPIRADQSHVQPGWVLFDLPRRDRGPFERVVKAKGGAFLPCSKI